MRSRNPDPVARFLGAGLMAVGGLIATLSGLCSLVMGGVMAFVSFESGRMTGLGLSELASSLGMVVIIGGPPLAVGVGLFLWGRSLHSPKAKLGKL